LERAITYLPLKEKDKLDYCNQGNYAAEVWVLTGSLERTCCDAEKHDTTFYIPALPFQVHASAVSEIFQMEPKAQ
jgi:hypothetical protein